jgi:tetratricopeptide (TPR) repeat protein
VNKRVDDPQAANTIIEKSDGSFLYAREAIELLHTTDMDLNSLPPGIGGAYYSSFRRIFQNTQVYEREYLPFFEAILAAKERLTRRELGVILGVDEAALRGLLRRVRSYVYELAAGDDTVLQVFHKSFPDWLVSENAGIYRVSLSSGDRLFAGHLLSCVENGSEPSEYLVKFGFVHVGRKGFEQLPCETQRSVLKTLIEGATRYGLLENEKDLIAEYERYLGKDHVYYYYRMNYDKKTSGEQLRRSVEEALAYLQTHEISEQERFDLICQIAFSYFYAGLAEKSFGLITAEREKHGKAFWKSGENEATYWHALALSAHDLDKNDVVVAATEKDISENRRQRKYYELFISMVNLFDGYMALGRLDEADRTAKQVLGYVEDRYFMHADDIIRICYANLLLTEGRVTESLAYYESGLALAKKIQHWDYLYGSVWRELAVARFGDRASLAALQRWRAKAEEANYSYIISLALCFHILSAHFLGLQDAALDTAAYAELCALNVPGHVLQATACLMLDGAIPFDEEQILSLTQRCVGVKGQPEIIGELFDRYASGMTEVGRAALDAWCASYVRPITLYKKRFRETLTENLSREVRLIPCRCSGCAAKCCYDGVYVTPADEKNITDFVNEHPELFSHLPKNFITDGDWPGMRSKRKTEKEDFNGYDESFPSHFTKTRCVFALPSGECSLQRAATDLQMHPWKIKPISCWFFPLRIAEDGSVLAPITDRDPDPNDLGENYPGYVSFLPCVRRDEEGVLWFEKYENEIEYYAFLQRNG